MSTISVLEIQQDPSAFLRRVEAGEELLVVRGEQAVAEVRPISPVSAGLRPYALCGGQFVLPADFDEPLPEEVLESFEGQ